MGLTDWFRRLFAPAPAGTEDLATQRVEYGEGGLSGLGRLEEIKAREEALETDEPPSDPAP